MYAFLKEERVLISMSQERDLGKAKDKRQKWQAGVIYDRKGVNKNDVQLRKFSGEKIKAHW